LSVTSVFKHKLEKVISNGAMPFTTFVLSRRDRALIVHNFYASADALSQMRRFASH